MIEKDIKNYKGRCRINLTKKDNEEINSTKVYLFTPEENDDYKKLKQLITNVQDNEDKLEELKSKNEELSQNKLNYEKLQEDFNTLSQEYEALKVQLEEKTKELEDISSEIVTLRETNLNLTKNIDTKDNEFNIINRELHQVKNKHIVTIENKDSEISYLKEIISDYESRGLGKRIRNKSPKEYISEPKYILIESKTINEEE